MQACSFGARRAFACCKTPLTTLRDMHSQGHVQAGFECLESGLGLSSLQKSGSGSSSLPNATCNSMADLQGLSSSSLQSSSSSFHCMLQACTQQPTTHTRAACGRHRPLGGDVLACNVNFIQGTHWWPSRTTLKRSGFRSLSFCVQQSTARDIRRRNAACARWSSQGAADWLQSMRARGEWCASARRAGHQPCPRGVHVQSRLCRTQNTGTAPLKRPRRSRRRQNRVELAT